MRLLTAGSLVRVQLGEPSKRYQVLGISFFLFYMRTNQRACAASQPNRHCLARSAQRARRVKQTARCTVCSQSGARSGLDVGSSPTGGAIKEIPSVRYLFFFVLYENEPTSLRSIAAKQTLFGEKRTKGATRKTNSTVYCL